MYRPLTLDRPWPAALALAAAIAAPGAALAQTSAPAPADTSHLKFPASTDHATLAAWLKLETDIAPETVVAVSPLALVAITKTQPMATPEGFEVTLRAETLDGAFSQQQGLASWRATMKLACKDHTFSMGEVTGYAARNLKGEGRPIQTALVGWKPVTAGTMQGEIWNARCGTDFKAPLAAAKATAAPAAPLPSPPRAATPVATPKPGPTPPSEPTTKAAPAAPPEAKPAPTAQPPSPPKATAPVPTSKPAPLPEPVASKPTPRPAPPTPPVRGGKSAQILSAPTAAEASHAIARLKAKLGDAMADLTAEVVPAQVKGKPTYRAIVSGFKTPTDAGLFCQKVEAAGGKCLVRADNGRTP